MYKLILKQLCCSIIYGILFLGLFHLLQDYRFYSETLGKISDNYEFRGDYFHYEIVKVHKPFVKIDPDALRHWDANIYYDLKDMVYDTATGRENTVRPAFFPLFPLIWKALHIGTREMCSANYILLIISLIILTNILVENEHQKFRIFLFCLPLPSIIFYMIPYTEAVFLISFSLVAAGIIKGNKLLLILGIFAVGLSRPAAIFMVLGLCSASILFLISAKDKKKWVVDFVFLLLPYVLAYGFVVLLQYYYSHDWLAMRHAQRSWPAQLQWPKAITDWSAEGFGMTSFAVCFISIPSIFYVIMRFLSIKRSENYISLLQLPKEAKMDFLFLASAFYCAFIFLFILFWKGGGMQSLSRYILASPAFFIMVIMLLKRRPAIKLSSRLLLIIASGLLLIILSKLSNWGGNRLVFEYVGMYLLIIFAIMVYIAPIYNRIALALLFIFGIASLFWTAYLFNDFLTPGWIFT